MVFLAECFGVPLGDRLLEMIEKLLKESQEQVLSFVRALYKTPA